MTQYSTKLLHYLQELKLRSGKSDFSFVEVFSGIGDFGGSEMLKRAFDILESEGYIEKTKYNGIYHLL